ncbi:MAG: hypothetical protein HUU38_07420 [Anaerolineales bacterium]|nr:hypothetical protein [Anaerolineales bacterium]
MNISRFGFLFILLLTACGALPATTQPTLTPTRFPTLPPPTETVTATPSPEPTLPPTAVPTAVSTATPTMVPAFFTLFGEAPIVAKGAAGAWDDRYTDPGAVVFHDGQFHMFRNGFQNWPASVQIGYVTSPDGFTWTEQGDDPVLYTDDIVYAGVAALASSALVEEDGTWVLYFYTWDGRTYPTSGGIGRATAPSPAGPWTPDAELVLRPGPASAWDGRHVLAPDVQKTDEGYRMYYSGYDETGIQQIGLATSADGLVWEKYPEPVLSPGEDGAWDANWVHQPRVVQTPDGWVMFYRGTKGAQNLAMGLGIATSEDGIHWEKSAQTPILTAKEVPRAKYFWFTNLLYHEGTLFLFWEVDINQTTEIYLSTHQGALEIP